MLKSVPKAARSKMETRIINRQDVMNWIIPDFQRPLRVNEKVRLMASELSANGGVIGGVITLGRIRSDSRDYVVDGQHRREAFLLSEMPEAIADVRTITFDDMGDMAAMFVQLQDHLVRMRPDDVLRGLERSVEQLQTLRAKCPFVAYENIRRGNNVNNTVSASLVIKLWAGSRAEAPVAGGATGTAAQIIREMGKTELSGLISFLNLAREAWGSDPENNRLWTGLNLGLCMWVFRRTVMAEPDRARRTIIMPYHLFKKCLSSLSANSDYIDWLSGRHLGERHRAPCYRRIRQTFTARVKEETGETPRMPGAAWVNN